MSNNVKQIILMADVVNSKLKEPKELIEGFKEIVKVANKKFKLNINSPLTITLGDEFQGIISNLSTALEIVFFLEEEIIKKQAKFQLRYVINEGIIETSINTKRAYEMLGEGLTMARQSLLDLKNTKYRFMVFTENEVVSQILNESFYVYQTIIQNWSIKNDYLLVASFIENKDYKIVSKVLNKDRSLIWKREKSLGINSYFAIKKIINLTVLLQ